jgi:hypothetical protein
MPSSSAQKQTRYKLRGIAYEETMRFARGFVNQSVMLLCEAGGEKAQVWSTGFSRRGLSFIT